MTPEEFKKEMQQIKDDYGDDREVVHVKMDELMCKVLVSLGYHEGVQIFNDTEMWYA